MDRFEFNWKVGENPGGEEVKEKTITQKTNENCSRSWGRIR
jgi:hypothetical protein